MAIQGAISPFSREIQQESTNFLDIGDKAVQQSLNTLHRLGKLVNTRSENQAATIIGRSTKLTGDVKIPSYENAFEISGLDFGGYRRTVVGTDGNIQSNAKVTMEHLALALPNGNGRVVSSILHAAETGENIGELSIAFIRNVGAPAPQAQFEWRFMDPQVANVLVQENLILLSIGYAGFQLTYNIMDQSEQSTGHVSVGFDLIQNKAL